MARIAGVNIPDNKHAVISSDLHLWCRSRPLLNKSVQQLVLTQLPKYLI